MKTRVIFHFVHGEPFSFSTGKSRQEVGYDIKNAYHTWDGLLHFENHTINLRNVTLIEYKCEEE